MIENLKFINLAVKGFTSCRIIAKVYRDNLMQRLSKQHPSYQWGRNKGYGTRTHQDAIRINGITRLHRIAFVETFLSHSSIGQTIELSHCTPDM